MRELASFREAVNQRVISEFRWTPTNIQFADALTKLMDAEGLIYVIKSGEIRIRPTQKELTSKDGRVKILYKHSAPAPEFDQNIAQISEMFEKLPDIPVDSQNYAYFSNMNFSQYQIAIECQ